MSTTIQTYLSGGGGGGLLFPRIITKGTQVVAANMSNTIYTATEECWVDLAVVLSTQMFVAINRAASISIYDYYFDPDAGFRVNVPSRTNDTTAITHFPDNIGGSGNPSLGRFYLNVGEWFALFTTQSTYCTYVAYTYKEAS